MNARTAIVVVLLAAPFSAQASDVIERLADHTGLSERKVQMILGARSSYAEYPYTYQRSLEKFRAALGEENYRRVMNGETVMLERKRADKPQQRVASHDQDAQPEPAGESRDGS